MEKHPLDLQGGTDLGHFPHPLGCSTTFIHYVGESGMTFKGFHLAFPLSDLLFSRQSAQCGLTQIPSKSILISTCEGQERDLWGISRRHRPTMSLVSERASCITWPHHPALIGELGWHVNALVVNSNSGLSLFGFSALFSSVMWPE